MVGGTVRVRGAVNVSTLKTFISSLRSRSQVCQFSLWTCRSVVLWRK